MCKLYEIHILVSINKVLLEHTDAHLFTHCLWLLSHCSSESESWQRLCTVHSSPCTTAWYTEDHSDTELDNTSRATNTTVL